MKTESKGPCLEGTYNWDKAQAQAFARINNAPFLVLCWRLWKARRADKKELAKAKQRLQARATRGNAFAA